MFKTLKKSFKVIVFQNYDWFYKNKGSFTQKHTQDAVIENFKEWNERKQITRISEENYINGKKIGELGEKSNTQEKTGI